MVRFTNVEDAQAYGRGILQGERVRFRRLEDADLEHFDQWWSAPEWAVLQQSSILPRPLSTTAEMFRQWSANSTSGSVGFSIVDRESDDLVGHITLYGATGPERAATLAIIINPATVGQGYGTDAVKTAVRYGFLQMGLNRIELTAWAFNARGIRAYSRAGFIEEGRRREAVFYDGDFHDQVVMAILRREWDAAQVPSREPGA